MTPQEQINFIVGPQVPIGDSYFDRTQIERGKFHGRTAPATPPLPTSSEWNSYYMLFYYDLPLSLRTAHVRSGDPEFLSLFQVAADSWWKQPEISEGKTRKWLEGIVTPAPRHAGLRGLILRAIDRPEMWDWIDAYVGFHLKHWLLDRLTSPSLFYGLREGAFMLHAAAILSQVLPDSFPLQSGSMFTGGATLRLDYLKNAERIAVEYYGRLQKEDGSWRWDDFDTADPYIGIMQPFMVGLLLRALIDVHRASSNETVKLNIQNQITKACRHLYSGGSYSTQLIPSLNVKLRGFHYLYHGGTKSNPTKYEKGDLPADWDTSNTSDVQNQRQAIGPIVGAFGYAYKLTGDPFFKTAGDDLWDAAYGPTDGIKNYMAGDAKSYNQNCSFAPSYLAWSGGVVEPLPLPTEPVPTQPTTDPLPTSPTPAPTTESTDGTKGTSIVDSQGAAWTIGSQKQTLRNGAQAGGGQGTIYKYVAKAVYVLGMDSNWYKWSGSWSSVGPNEPGSVTTTPTPTPTPTPEPTPVPTTPTEPAPVVRKVAWPSGESKQNAVVDLQWKERYRFKRHLSGAWVEFERVS